MKIRIDLNLFYLVAAFLILCSNHGSNAQEHEIELPAGKIVFSKTVGNQSDIYVTSTDRQSQIRLTDHDSGDMLPSCAPNGDKIVFRTFRDGNPEIYTMNANGSNKRRLTNNQVDDCNPKWSPQGNLIVFERVLGNNVSLFLMDTSGNNIRRLTDSTSRSLNASWSPDGYKVVYVSGNSNYDLFIIDIRTKEVTQLTFTPEIQEKFPAWSPDGRVIAHKCYGNEKPGIYLIDTLGRNKKFLCETNSTSSPTWSTDSKWLVDGGLFLIRIKDLARSWFLEGEDPDWLW